MFNSKITIDAFTTIPAVERFFKIEPAKKFIPQWFKQVPSSVQAPVVEDMMIERPTIKQCVGFTDLYNKGFMLPLWSDVVIESNDNSIRWAFADMESTIDSHPKEQMGKLVQGQVHVKLESPWKLKCNKKIDIVWQQPSYNLITHFHKLHILPGVVNYGYQAGTNVNLMMMPNTRIELEAGTPLAHLIPITDKKVQIKCHLVDDKEYHYVSNRTLYPAFRNRYAKGMRKMMKE